MILGVTATQRGLTRAQRDAALSYLQQLPLLTEFHHGGCVGGDEDLHFLVRGAFPGVPIFIHRGDTPEKWAHFPGDTHVTELRALPNLERNKVIVKTVGKLWAFPGERQEVLRSGTWATIRTAKRAGRSAIIFYPDGTWTGW